MPEDRPTDRLRSFERSVIALVDDPSSFAVLLRQASLIADEFDAGVLIAVASWRLIPVVTPETGALLSSGLLADPRAWILEVVDSLEWNERRHLREPLTACATAGAVRRLAQAHRASHIVVSTSLQSLRPLLPIRKNIAPALCRPGDRWSIVAVPVMGAWKDLWRHVLDTERAN